MPILSKLITGRGGTSASLGVELDDARARHADLTSRLEAAEHEHAEALAARRAALLGDADAAALKKIESAVLAASSKSEGLRDATAHLAAQIAELEARLAEAVETDRRESEAAATEHTVAEIESARHELNKAFGPVAAALRKLVAIDAATLALPVGGGQPADGRHVAGMVLSEALQSNVTGILTPCLMGAAAQGQAAVLWKYDEKRGVLSGASLYPGKTPPDAAQGGSNELLAAMRQRADRIRRGEASKPDAGPVRLQLINKSTGARG